MKKQHNIWKYVLAIAATGALGVFMTGVSKVAMVNMERSNSFPKKSGAVAAQQAAALMEHKCADCHGADASYSKFLNLLSFGKLQRDVEGAQRAFTLNPYEWRSGNVDYLKMDRVLSTRRMPPSAYTTMHPGKRLTPRDVAVLRNRYSREGALMRMFSPIAEVPAPTSEWEKARIQLGKYLFHDARLSTNNEISCASCHDLTKGGTDNLPKSPGVPCPEGKPQFGGVNAPTVYNAAGNIRQFWDGRAKDLKEQAGGPPLNPVEMGFTCAADWETIANKLKQDGLLMMMFSKVYGEQGVTADTITDAIAAYEKTLVTPDSSFDMFLKGDKNALSEEQLSGLHHYMNFGCATCHSGPTLGGISFEYINTHADMRALAKPEGKDAAGGLADFTKKAEHKDMFRVPNLRNVALTAPYFHTGSVATLEEAVKIMCLTQASVDPSETVVHDITRFLEAQTGKYEGRPLDTLTPKDVEPAGKYVKPEQH